MPCGKNTDVSPDSTRRLRRARDDAVGHEDRGDRAVCLEVDLAVVRARLHAPHQLLLRGVHRANQVQELARLGRIGAGDVAGVARVLRSRVDQERPHASGAHAIEHLVVQHCRMPAVADDVVVGQFLFARPGCLAVREMDLVLRGARPEGFFRRPVGAHARDRRERHALDFIGCLDRAGIIQRPRDSRGIVVAQPLGCRPRFSQDCPARLPGQLPQLCRGTHDFQFEMADPVALRTLRRQVPIVVRLGENELRAAPRPVDDETVRARVRQPGAVAGVRPERVGGIVQVVVDLASRARDQSVVTACIQSPVGPCHDLFQVPAEQLGQCLFRHVRTSARQAVRVTGSGSCRKIATFACPWITDKIRARDRTAKPKIELFPPRNCTCNSH